MRWFKFYGQDWLTDIKIIRLSTEDKLCYITLLCLASASDNELGTIKNCDEESIIRLTGLCNDPYNDNNEYKRAVGFFKRFSDKGMITIDNADNITINSFNKRQTSSLSGYERVKRWREKHKNKAKKGKMITNDNGRVDKIRVDKNKNTLAGKPALGNEIPEIIKLFEPVNPLIGKYYGNTSQRAAVERMLKVFGREKLESMINSLSAINQKSYWPKSTTPCQLENNIPIYKAKNEEEKLKGQNNNKVVFI